MGIDLDSPLSIEDRDRMIDGLAAKIVGRGLETPAVLFLEMHKPLSYVASQAMLVALPFLGPVFGAQNAADVSKILKDRENLDLLIARIEEMADTEEKGRTATVEQE